eukprot:g45233.t1
MNLPFPDVDTVVLVLVGDAVDDDAASPRRRPRLTKLMRGGDVVALLLCDGVVLPSSRRGRFPLLGGRLGWCWMMWCSGRPAAILVEMNHGVGRGMGYA